MQSVVCVMADVLSYILCLRVCLLTPFPSVSSAPPLVLYTPHPQKTKKNQTNPKTKTNANTGYVSKGGLHSHQVFVWKNSQYSVGTLS